MLFGFTWLISTLPKASGAISVTNSGITNSVAYLTKSSLIPTILVESCSSYLNQFLGDDKESDEFVDLLHEDINIVNEIEVAINDGTQINLTNFILVIYTKE
ncbi:MAG: hypothetical protein K2L64_03195 [Ureaplasma sp.]|nr:hypothetical protein [Ureaplasma sp.]